MSGFFLSGKFIKLNYFFGKRCAKNTETHRVRIPSLRKPYFASWTYKTASFGATAKRGGENEREKEWGPDCNGASKPTRSSSSSSSSFSESLSLHSSKQDFLTTQPETNGDIFKRDKKRNINIYTVFQFLHAKTAKPALRHMRNITNYSF